MALDVKYGDHLDFSLSSHVPHTAQQPKSIRFTSQMSLKSTFLLDPPTRPRFLFLFISHLYFNSLKLASKTHIFPVCLSVER